MLWALAPVCVWQNTLWELLPRPCCSFLKTSKKPCLLSGSFPSREGEVRRKTGTLQNRAWTPLPNRHEAATHRWKWGHGIHSAASLLAPFKMHGRLHSARAPVGSMGRIPRIPRLHLAFVGRELERSREAPNSAGICPSRWVLEPGVPVCYESPEPSCLFLQGEDLGFPQHD